METQPIFPTENVDLQGKMIGTVVSGNQYASKMQSEWSTKWFTDDRKAIVKLINTYFEKKQPCPSLDMLAINLELQESAREYLQTLSEKPPKPINNEADYDDAVRQCKYYASAQSLKNKVGKAMTSRDLYEAGIRLEEAINELEKPEDDRIFEGGSQRVLDLLKTMFYPDKPKPFIPAPFKDWEEAIGGWSPQEVVLWAANFGGAKSSWRRFLAAHDNACGHTTCEITLEMGEVAEFARKSVAVSNISIKGPWNNKWRDDSARDKAFQDIIEYQTKGPGRLNTVYVPQGSRDVAEIFASAPKGRESYYFDQATTTSAGDDSLIGLQTVINTAKVYAIANNCVVHVFTQLNAKTEELWGGQALAFQADWCYTWIYNHTKNKNGFIKLRNVKDRMIGAGFHPMIVFGKNQQFTQAIGRPFTCDDCTNFEGCERGGSWGSLSKCNLFEHSKYTCNKCCMMPQKGEKCKHHPLYKSYVNHAACMMFKDADKVGAGLGFLPKPTIIQSNTYKTIPEQGGNEE